MNRKKKKKRTTGVFQQIFRTAFLRTFFTAYKCLLLFRFFFFLNALLFLEEAIEKYKCSGVTKHSFKATTKKYFAKKIFCL